MKILKTNILGLVFFSTLSYAKVDVLEVQKLGILTSVTKFIDKDTDTLCYVVKSSEGVSIYCKTFIQEKTDN